MKMKITAELTARIGLDEEAGCFSAYCPELHVYSAANTMEDAEKALRSAVAMTMTGYWEQGILFDQLVKRGFQPQPVHEEEYLQTEETPLVVPLPLFSHRPSEPNAVSNSAASV